MLCARPAAGGTVGRKGIHARPLICAVMVPPDHEGASAHRRVYGRVEMSVVLWYRLASAKPWMDREKTGNRSKED